MLKKTLLIGSLTLAISTIADAETCQLVKDVDFNNHNGSYKTYDQSMASKDFGKLESNGAAKIRGLDKPGESWKARNKVGNGHLRLHYPAKTAGGKNSGLLFDQKFKDAESAVMEYRVKFSKDFVWAAGGKLPGLAGKGGKDTIPVGCTQKKASITNGFSTRLMWRKNGDLVAYTYLPNRLEPQKGNCGIDYKFATVKADQWYTIRQTVKMNTPGKKDGLLKMEIDGKVGLEMKDVEFRQKGKSNVKVNDMLFQTYRGGGADDKRFHSPQNDYVYIDDVKVWRDCTDPDKATSKPSQPSGSNGSKPKGPNNDYKFAVSEGKTVKVNGTVNIAFGANNKFNFFYSQRNDIECSTRVFGDPIKGVKKHCFVKVVEPANSSKPSVPSEPSKPSTGGGDNNCQKYTGSDKLEINLNKGACVQLPKDLKGKTLQVWDSDKASCDFRGKVKTIGGKGTLNVDSNYVSTVSLTGKKIQFAPSNGCKSVQMRMF